MNDRLMAAQAEEERAQRELEVLTDRLFERGHRSAVLPEEYAAALARTDRARRERRAAQRESGR